MVEVTQAAALRFWAKADIRGEDECWEWMGAKSSYGYGRFYIARRFRPATRVAWELHNQADFPEGKLACHTCDNPGCINPRHIWPGTQSENLKDCVSKGRHKSVPHAKCKRGHALTDENRILLPEGGSRCKECARANGRERTQRYRDRIGKPETALSERRRRAWDTRRSKYGVSGCAS